jgi:hypothetical protein
MSNLPNGCGGWRSEQRRGHPYYQHGRETSGKPRTHRAQARGELGLAIELPQFGGQEMPNLQHRVHAVRGDFPGVRSVEDAAIFKESDEAASCRYFQFGSLPRDAAKRSGNAREPVRDLRELQWKAPYSRAAARPPEDASELIKRMTAR